MLEDGLIDPAEKLLYSNLLVSPLAVRSLRHSIVNVLLEKNLNRPVVYKCISHERKSQTILEMIPEDVSETHYQDLLKVYGEIEKGEISHNETYFSSSDDIDLRSPGTFVSDDGYVFCRDELEYLLQTGVNPFNRREFSEREMTRLSNMVGILTDYWFMFDLSAQRYKWIFSPDEELKDVDYERLIDAFFDRNDLFTYSGRISDVMTNLENNTMCVISFTGLIMGVGTIMTMQSPDFSIDQCVSFARGREDPYDIEDINTYYGIIFNHLGEKTPLRKNFLQWIFLILDTTEKLSEGYLNARLLSLSLIIQILKIMV